MIYHKSKQVGFIEHGEANIDKIMHNGECVFTQGFDRDASGIDSVTLDGTIGKDLVDWSITGNTVQNGTPSPENIVEVKGIGDRTGNLWETSTYESITVVNFRNTFNTDTTKIKYKENTQYTFSCNIKGTTAGTGLFKFTYTYTDGNTKSSGWITGNVGNVVLVSDANKTITSLTVTNCNYPDLIEVSNIMLNEGSTPLPYEPYGVKIPVVSRGKNLFSAEICDFGRWYQASGSITSLVSAASSPVMLVKSEYLSVEIFGNIPYSYSFVWFDQDNTFISRTHNPTPISERQSYSAPTNAKYFIFQVALSSDTSVPANIGDISALRVMLYHGRESTPYEPYRPPITTTQYLPTPLMANERLTPTAREVKWYTQKIESVYRVENLGGGIYRLRIQPKETPADYKQQINAKCNRFLVNTNYAYIGFIPTPTIIYITQEIEAFSSVETAEEWFKENPTYVTYLLANPTTESVTTPPIGTLRNEEKTIKGTTTIITTDTEVLPTQIEASYKSNKADYVVVNFATADGNVFTTANGDTYTIKMRKSQYDTMMINELLNLLEVM